MTNPLPEPLRRAGLEHLTDNLPEGVSLDIARDFVRIFRADLEQRLYGWTKPAPAVTRRLPQEDR
ncbi:hypothetical protein [Propionivibrio sp.]|uniref:hypothetical protein n=1 Tax=Propionivibrio sp. TaxID=2212460 RepID=UPI0039E384AC